MEPSASNVPGPILCLTSSTSATLSSSTSSGMVLSDNLRPTGELIDRALDWWCLLCCEGDGRSVGMCVLADDIPRGDLTGEAETKSQ